ncbi:MAG: hypothetical protein WBH47_18120 [Streptosporangiaceae bacterium]
MLINTPASALPTATVLSDEAALPCAARPSAGFGPGAVVRAGASLGGDYPTGIAGGAGKAAGGYVPGIADVVLIPRIWFSATDSTVQSTVQHNTMTRLYPVTRGGVGPHPARERIPA